MTFDRFVADLRELLSNLVYKVNYSSGFPADLSPIDTVDKLDSSDDIGELLEAA